MKRIIITNDIYYDDELLQQWRKEKIVWVKIVWVGEKEDAFTRESVTIKL